ncbi:MAG: asparagine synthase (glutamine-hydrolyzing) [Bacteroidetes bacterium]|nr:asparagine synthase (glutamine-hydrolyzing) [Bacteroidota bacterium]
MCGISGIFRQNGSEVKPGLVREMLTQIQYRGPDESGIYIGEGVGLGSVRLSIIDLAQGQQPMSTEDGELWIVYNGEIFNYIELRAELEALGYKFRTNSDTEVLLLLYRHFREGCLEKLNGQFAFAIWNSSKKELFLARDRMGIRPLFYHKSKGEFLFASEIKCLLESDSLEAELDTEALNQVFTFWTIPSPGTVFKGIYELPPGHYMIRNQDREVIRPYWELDFQAQKDALASMSFEERMEELGSRIEDSVRLRLRSDVQVAAYLSGGLDSSATTHIIKKVEPGVLNTFSIGFEDDEFDETPYQESVSAFLDTRHRSISCSRSDIAENFTKVLWHSEIPLLRTGAVPMFRLSNLVHENGIKVVITGEGADEFLGGYNIFKETLIREFWSKEPDSRIRPLLLQKLYPYLAQFKGKSGNMHRFFFGHRLTETDSPVYSHMVRWNNSKHIRTHFSEQLRDSQKIDPVESLLSSLPEGMGNWDTLTRAQWLESKLFLSGYLLSSQGDRVSMAHSVEGRYPFLDHRVVELCMGLRSQDKLRGLNEKYILKKLMNGHLPESVVKRSKQAYRAPVATGLLAENAPDYLREMLSAEQLRKTGFFNPDSVEKLTGKMRSGGMVTENENMALAGILSTQILSDLYVSGNNPYRETRMRTDCPVYYDKHL